MTVASQVKQTLASLKGAQATLELYAQQTVIEQEQMAFANSLEKISGIIVMLEKRISAMEFEEPQYKGF
ncbi:DUF1657 domain-containing protein [Ammoniphilus resinae]|uniref:DUF1657 domain-containing protein n=1 Tax=Ammoniphilus resinae TaxID=861532 RepID=A0ABS4GRQ2_9BACL|nr:DUF1657 domain-containing protein [Ammoniphilus resinae]MBP1932960.1 hypothetical protein [Ammoniphilus resinae]